MSAKINKDPVSLSDSITVLSGIGPRRAEVFKSKNIFSVEDLLRFMPRDYIDRSRISFIRDLEENTFGVVVVDVVSMNTDGKKRMQVKTCDSTGYIDFVFFGGIEFLKDRFEPGSRVHAWGRISEFRGTFQIVHPEFKVLKERQEPEKGIFPLYPGSADLKDVFADSKLIAAAVKDAFARTASIYHEILPFVVLKKRKFPAIKTVFHAIHFPTELDYLQIEKCKDRLRYEEAFLLLFKFGTIRKMHDNSGIFFVPSVNYAPAVYSNFGFKPTEGQKRAIEEIEADLFSKDKMNRLLQGDVGSGKTFVCAIASSHVLEAGYQVLLMAPTEILARQHVAEMARLYNNLPITVELLVSDMDTATRDTVLEKAKNGVVGIWVGTHALISSATDFRNVGLVIVDEQHRFGVRQRMALRQKGINADMLVATATPIPRTVAMALYGDLSVSVIEGLPPGRQIVKTYRVSEAKRDDMYRFINDKIKTGGRTFVVLPKIDAGEEKSELKSVMETVEYLKTKEYFNERIGYVHGKLTTAEKRTAIESFRNGEKPILVSTTVVEVGIDVPEADIMIIEHPERFGLAQLHQLRGRVGRGKRESFCFLLPRCNEKEEVLARLDGFISTNDGFEIAELDFENRGAGELSGLNQSGFPEFKFLDLFRDRKLVELARNDADEVVENPGLMSAAEMKSLQTGLKIFDGLRTEILTTS
jgi:ATP-dependent DNA helicase RecG